MREETRARLRYYLDPDTKLSWQTFTVLLLAAIGIGALVGLVIALL